MTNFEGKENSQKELNFGEILYPCFNKLAPLLVESLLISKYISTNHKTISNLLSLTWSTISFPFTTKILPSLTSSSPSPQSTHSPHLLSFHPLTSTVKKLLKEISLPACSSQLPLYKLFKDQSVSEVLAASLLEVFFSDAKDKENVSGNVSSKNTLRDSSMGRRSKVGEKKEEEIKRKDVVTDEMKVIAAAMVN